MEKVLGRKNVTSYLTKSGNSHSHYPYFACCNWFLIRGSVSETIMGVSVCSLRFLTKRKGDLIMFAWYKSHFF